MRSRALSLWLMLVGLFLLQVAVSLMAAGCGEYSRRMLNEHFSAGAKAVKEVTGLPYSAIINQAGKKYDVSPELIAAVIKAESSFEPRALSKAGAYGLMQVIPSTWRLVNKEAKVCYGRHNGDCSSECFYSPELNVEVGTYYLGQLIRRFNGQIELAVAAYNAGPGAVDKYGGIPPYAETTEYARRVIGIWYKISGKAPPGGLMAADWLIVQHYLAWSMAGTVILAVMVGKHLYRRHKSFHWR